MKSKTYRPGSNDPVWLEEGHRINETVFCETFISTHKIVFCNGFFFNEDGRVTDEMPLRSDIYAELRDYASNNVARIDMLHVSERSPNESLLASCFEI